MARFTFEIEFIDEATGESFICKRAYVADEEPDWQEIWDDIVKGGDLQMVPVLVSTEDEDD